MYGIDVDPTAHTLAEPRIRAAAAGREGFGLRLLRGNYRCVLGVCRCGRRVRRVRRVCGGSRTGDGGPRGRVRACACIFAWGSA